MPLSHYHTALPIRTETSDFTPTGSNFTGSHISLGHHSPALWPWLCTHQPWGTCTVKSVGKGLQNINTSCNLTFLFLAFWSWENLSHMFYGVTLPVKSVCYPCLFNRLCFVKNVFTLNCYRCNTTRSHMNTCSHTEAKITHTMITHCCWTPTRSKLLLFVEAQQIASDGSRV